MRLGQAPVLAGRLHGGGGFHRLAESLDRDARRRRDMFVGDGLSAGTMACFVFGERRLVKRV